MRRCSGSRGRWCLMAGCETAVPRAGAAARRTRADGCERRAPHDGSRKDVTSPEPRRRNCVRAPRAEVLSEPGDWKRARPGTGAEPGPRPPPYA